MINVVAAFIIALGLYQVDFIQFLTWSAVAVGVSIVAKIVMAWFE